MTTMPTAHAVQVGDVGPALRLGPISRTDLVRYAGASGDFNPMHHDDVAAREAGYPSVFAMGLYLGGVMARMVVDWFGLAALRSYELRFLRQTWPQDEIAISSHVTEVVAGLATIAIDARHQDGAAMAAASATVRTGRPG